MIRAWPVCVLVVLSTSCAASRSVEVARLERRVRELEDEVYRLERARQDLQRRLALVRSATPVAPTTPRVTPQTGGEPTVDPVEAVVVPEGSLAPEPTGVAAADSLRRANEAYQRADYGVAAQLYKEFLRTSPDDPRAIEARYSLGEALYADGNFAQAIVELGVVVERDPNGSRAPDALYKIALSYYELGYRRNTREHLERLVRQYPESRAADAGKPLLDRLGR